MLPTPIEEGSDTANACVALQLGDLFTAVEIPPPDVLSEQPEDRRPSGNTAIRFRSPDGLAKQTSTIFNMCMHPL